jgi:hypothetical protein
MQSQNQLGRPGDITTARVTTAGRGRRGKAEAEAQPAVSPKRIVQVRVPSLRRAGRQILARVFR